MSGIDAILSSSSAHLMTSSTMQAEAGSLEKFSTLLSSESSMDNPEENAQLKEKLIEFSGSYWGILLNMMYDTVEETDPMFSGGHGGKLFKKMQLDEMGKTIARSGQDALTQNIINTYTKTQNLGRS